MKKEKSCSKFRFFVLYMFIFSLSNSCNSSKKDEPDIDIKQKLKEINNENSQNLISSYNAINLDDFTKQFTYKLQDKLAKDSIVYLKGEVIDISKIGINYKLRIINKGINTLDYTIAQKLYIIELTLSESEFNTIKGNIELLVKPIKGIFIFSCKEFKTIPSFSIGSEIVDSDEMGDPIYIKEINLEKSIISIKGNFKDCYFFKDK